MLVIVFWSVGLSASGEGALEIQGNVAVLLVFSHFLLLTGVGVIHRW